MNPQPAIASKTAQTNKKPEDLNHCFFGLRPPSLQATARHRLFWTRAAEFSYALSAKPFQACFPDRRVAPRARRLRQQSGDETIVAGGWALYIEDREKPPFADRAPRLVRRCDASAPDRQCAAAAPRRNARRRGCTKQKPISAHLTRPLMANFQSFIDGRASGAGGSLTHRIRALGRFSRGRGSAPRSYARMAKRMLIDATHPEETRVVVPNGNRLEEFDFESSTKKQVKGNIYLAKVTRVEPSLQAAFVEYGNHRHGFLAFSEIHPDYYNIPVGDREPDGYSDCQRGGRSSGNRTRFAGWPGFRWPRRCPSRSRSPPHLKPVKRKPTEAEIARTASVPE